MKRKIVSLFLALVLIFSSIPLDTIQVLAETEYAKPTIYVDSKYSAADSIVDVNVLLVNNPGIAGARITLSYSPKLTLVEAANGEKFSALDYINPGSFSSPCNFNWDSENAVATEDGVLLTLKFRVSPDATPNDKLDVNLSYRYGDIYDSDLNDLDFDIVGGDITIINYIPGDVNNDGTVNGKDVTLLRRYNAGGYDVEILEAAADVNADGVINGKDVTLIRRYNAGGYDVELLPSNPKCQHIMEEFPAKEDTCTEDGNIAYWYCSVCDKYFKDKDGNTRINLEDTIVSAKGHNVVMIPEVEPTYDKSGFTEGKKCSICETIIVAPIEIPPIEKDEYVVTYKVNPNDAYLAQQNINEIISEKEEKEQKSYKLFLSDEGLGELPSDINIPGYNFIGWAESAVTTAPTINSIPAGTRKNITLYAKFEKVQFTVTLDCAEASITNNEINYYVDQAKSLGTNPSMTGFTFLGWSDENGKIWNNIPVGTTGNFTLRANWISERNKATPVNDLKKPIMFEDEATGSYMFVYEIGTISNVPLYTVNDYGYMVAGSPVTSTSKAVSGKITESNAKTLANTVSNATTKTSAWTLSKDWNKISTVSESHAKDMGIDTSTIKYDADSSSIHLSKSKTEGGSQSKTENYGVNGMIYGKSTAEIGAEAKFPVKCVNVGVSGKLTGETGGEIKGYYDATKVNDSYWNTQKSYDENKSHTSSLTTSTNISKRISDTYGYSTSSSQGGSQSATEAVVTSESKSQEYSATVAYETETVETKTETVTKTANVTGYWREIVTGKMHVFGVVAYDMSTSTYTVYTYNILDSSNPQPFMDFSTSPDYDDYENGFIKFEIPYDVNEYISETLGYSEGLIINRNTGIIEEYDGSAEHIHIPDYVTINNGDGSYTPIKVTGIASDVFTNNTNITSIRLGKYITSIPNNAFKGCTSLKAVEYNELNSIGNNAFSGCVSLGAFTVEKTVTNLGVKAFEYVPSVIINSANESVATAGAGCAATEVTLNLKSLTEELKDITLSVANSTSTFTINGRNGNKEVMSYSGVKLESNAEATIINGMIFKDNTGVPIKLKSSNVTLNNVTIEETPDLAIIIDSDNVNLYLQGTNNITTVGTNAILCKNPTLLKSQSSNEMNSLKVINGLLLYCGIFTDEKNYFDGEKKEISESAFDNYLNGSLDWVLASEAPEGATIVNQKWTYDETVTKTSNSSNVPAGYTLTNTTWAWGAYGSWSGWSTTKYTASDSRQVETKNIAAVTKKQYNYSRWFNSARTRFGPCKGTWSGTYCGNTESKGWSDTKLKSYDSQYSNQYGGTFYCYGSSSNPWYNETTRTVTVTPASTQYRYRDRSKVYTYYFTKFNSYESSSEVMATDTISNIQHWVQYVD